MAPQPSTTTIKMYAAREEIYPREVQGRFASLRWLCLMLTQLVFYGLPWISWNGRQAILFDVAQRKFYLFGIILWPQDFIYLAVLLIICAFSLFLFTAIAGRLWCGYACPQTVYTELFLWIERSVEGTRSARMRLDRQPWGFNKVFRKTIKHVLWIVVAGWTGLTFVGYFIPIHALIFSTVQLSLGAWATFWIVFYSIATYGNAGWMREQVCKYMCPYARFQSAMLDKDTLIITYDKLRGEPRTAWNEREQKKSGDCIDCSMCVQVCPTGIDIRRGLQYECIGCAACVDACNSVMQKVGFDPGLIRYSTERAIEQKLTPAKMRKHILRPRILVYIVLLSAVMVAFAAALITRPPLKLDIIRDRGVMARLVEDDQIENVYRLQIMNTSEHAHRYHIALSGIPSITLISESEAQLEATSSRLVPMRVRVDQGAAKPGSNPIEVTLTAMDDPAMVVREKAMFFVPK